MSPADRHPDWSHPRPSQSPGRRPTLERAKLDLQKFRKLKINLKKIHLE